MDPYAHHVLDGDAAYGQLPFDRFVLDRWDYSRPISQDQKQWNEHVERWLELSWPDREQFIEMFYDLKGNSPRHEYIPTQEQIERVLRPHQTFQERYLNLVPTTLWLRTCYAPEFAGAYSEMTLALDEIGLGPEQMLDNKALYNLGTEWNHILKRIPSLCDKSSAQDYDIESAPPPDHPRYSLLDAGARQVTMLYLLDRQALEDQLVTVLWLDCHGECVWWGRINPDDQGLMLFTGWMSSTCGLSELVNEDSDPKTFICEKGTLIDWIG